MILFVSKYPDPSVTREGMMKRVEAIDQLFSHVKRAYLEIHLRPFLFSAKREVTEKCTVFSVSLFIHWPLIFKLVSKSAIIYVHSIDNALRAIPLYFSNKVVTDMHGLIPEERLLSGQRCKSRVFSFVEYIVMTKSRYLVTVSNAMSDFFLEKYRNLSAQMLSLPIFQSDATAASAKNYDGKLTILYSGGLQPWQNIDKMLTAIKRTLHVYNFQIFSGDESAFETRLRGEAIPETVTVKSLPKEQLNEFYKKAHMGFLLRDHIPVNSVACPTKLVEYMDYGIIPIVLQPEIGDFNRIGYAYLTYEQFLNGAIPTGSELESMARNNHQVIARMRSAVHEGIEQLKGIVEQD